MGDGGVACMPLQQNVMERFPISEQGICGGNNGNGNSSSNALNSKSVKLPDKKPTKKIIRKVKKLVPVKKGVLRKTELATNKVADSCFNSVDKVDKEDVEEGELGTLKSPISDTPNAQPIPEKLVRIENGDLSDDNGWNGGQVEKEDITPSKWRKWEPEKEHNDITMEENMKGETTYWKGTKEEIEKGEFIPDNARKVVKPSRFENGTDHTPPPYKKYQSDDFYRRKDFQRNGNQHNRGSYRWESAQDRDDSYKKEYSNGKNYDREYSSGNRLKRYGNDSDRNYGDSGDYAASKNRRLTDNSHSDHYSHHSAERFYRNYSSSSKYHESSSSRAYYDRRGYSPCRFERSPSEKAHYNDNRDRSPVGRDRSPYGRERSLYGHERSPYGNRHNEPRNRNSGNAERSPHDRARYHDRRGRTPNSMDKSPLNRNRPNNYRELNRKSGANEKYNPPHAHKGQDDRIIESDPSGTNFSVKESQGRSSIFNGTDEKMANSESQKEDLTQSHNICKECTSACGAPHEELLSMEEDMDICDTPPHVSLVPDSSQGKWIYLDYFGFERGPSKLSDLKQLVQNGVLESDHFIKHSDSDRWVTIENAVSPMVTVSFPSIIVSDTITQLVNPPEAPGNILADTGDALPSGVQSGEEGTVTWFPLPTSSDGNAAMNESFDDSHIDGRVEALLAGIQVKPGQELKIIGEALQITHDHALLEGWLKSEGFISSVDQPDRKSDDTLRYFDMKTKESAELRLTAPPEMDGGFGACGESSEWSYAQWSCKGGDWRRNDEVMQDKFCRKKLVLNDGVPFFQMPKCAHEDPRWSQKDDSYCQNKRLDLPNWAFSGLEPATLRGVRGTLLPVVRINALVVKEQGSLVSDTRVKAISGKERYTSRSGRTFSSSSDFKRSSAEGDSHSNYFNNHELQALSRSDTFPNAPKDRLCTVDDLQLNLGDWYYFDGAGHEHGPFSFSDLHVLVDRGTIQKYSSIHRKFDNTWVPVSCCEVGLATTAKIVLENDVSSSNSLAPTCKNMQPSAVSDSSTSSLSFHNQHPQFIGYTRWKLHDLIMKSFKSREFAAAINEVLDPWLGAKLPKKEIENNLYWKSETDSRGGKRARLQSNESDEEYEIEENLPTGQRDETTFEDLCGSATFNRENYSYIEAETASWGLLDGHLLARVFHFLRFNMKSIALASWTCKHWRYVAEFYKDISRQVDVSAVGTSCTDSIISNIMSGYNKERICQMVLNGCSNISSSILEEILCSFHCISSIEIKGCRQFEEVSSKFPNVTWIRSRNLHGANISEDSHSRHKSLKQIAEKNPSFYKHRTQVDDFGELKNYLDSVDKRDSANQLFRRSLYKRTKLYDARKSSAILSRDARIRQWSIKKSENSYKRMEGFLVSSLKDIMKENTFDFFVPKVAKIEDRMKNGYYISHGLAGVKEDISRMCRDSIKAKSRGAGDMNSITTLFLKLATRLEQSSRFSYERDEIKNSWKDDLSVGFGSTSAKHKKKLDKVVTDRKYRSNGSSFWNGGVEQGGCASDREIKKRLSKLNRKSLDSGSETSDDLDHSSEDGKSDSENTYSGTESDSGLQSESLAGESRRDGYLTAHNTFGSDDREWGARMTKASLVPPVTRKYEVIDQYVIVADEEEVQRKMSVSLPDDYAEKLESLKNGTEDLDMELPEVKEYQPRKELGDEVIEQEVYGIDPYTHNLLLDSMPEDLDWPLSEKQLFIEVALLRTLNRKVRNFTGSGNTPMIYHLKPVIEEMEKTAEEDCDMRMVQMCHSILMTMDSRSHDKYVAYRKGLGVVCSKKGGFGVEDFVIEFLGEVYPAWKWFEKQDGIRSLQKDSKDVPEFYNIYLERPKGDGDGYDLVVVDAMHKANYASRICHSCRPNCEAKVTAVDGRYQIGIYAVREIQYDEEVTFDYNSVTESKEEYEASVCLCGSQGCRGSYLNLTGEESYQKVLKVWHGVLDRYQLMIEACELNSVSDEDYDDLAGAGLGRCLLGGLPAWLIAFSARLVRFINLERAKLPKQISNHNIEEKQKYYTEVNIEVEKSDAEVQAEGVFNNRLQNLAITLDKVRYVIRRVFGDPKLAPPPLKKLSAEEMVSFLWNGEGSLVEQLLQCMAPHVEDGLLNDLMVKIRAHDPSRYEDVCKGLQKSLLWLRDAIRELPCTYKCRHDAAADLIHIHAYTKCFYRVQEYKSVVSDPLYISPLDLGKYADKLGSSSHEFSKTYGENYCLGQLLFWYIQTNSEPDSSLIKASRGCLSLPDISSFYAKVQKPSRQRVYGSKMVKFMLKGMEKKPQRPWPRDRIWSFNPSAKVFGSPMLDAVAHNTPLDREMVQWLKHRPSIFHAMWDR